MAQYDSFLAPHPFAFLSNAGAMIYRTPEKYRYKVDVACSSVEELQSSVKSGWGPCRQQTLISFHHQLVDRFPFGVDGSLQFPRLAHGLVPSRQILSVVVLPCVHEDKRSPGTYRADCNSITSICA